MKTKALFLLLLSIFFFEKETTAQSSYQIAMAEELKMSIWDFQVNEDTSLSIFAHGFLGQSGEQPPPVVLLELNAPNDLTAKGVRFFLKRSNGGSIATPWTLSSLFSRLLSEGSMRLLNYEGNFIGYDINTKKAWFRHSEHGSQLDNIFSDFGNQLITIVSEGRDSNDVVVNQLDSKTGDDIDNFALRIKEQVKFDYFYPIEQAVDPTDNSTIISGDVRYGEKRGIGIIRVSPTFDIQTKLLSEGQGFRQHRFSARHLITSPEGEIYWIGFSGIDNNTGQSDLIMIKFDKKLNVEFSKRYYSEKFPFYNFSLNFDEFNQPVLAYSTRGTYPLILAKLNDQGEILSETGYALYTPKIKVGKDGALFMTTSRHFDDTGDLFSKNIIAKTTKEGLISNCENYSARLRSSDITFEFEDFKMTKHPISGLEWGTADTQPYEIEFEPFCDLPDFPTPDFLAPDTVCLGECIRIDSVKNQNSNGREWSLESETVNLTVADSFEFAHCFSEPGTYSIRQTIWMLGVDYSFEKIIEVLPPLEINIQPDSVLCKLNTPLNIESNRPIQNIEWNTGETEPIIYTTDSGIYSVTADDGYCRAGDTTFLEYIFEKIDTNLAIQLPDSVTACEVHLPFKLKPTSDYSTVFSDENAMLDSVFLLSKPGEYFFSTEVFGCRFSKKIDFKTDACKAEIFTPSAFSPNNDGINDEFIPLGKNIEPTRLEIYDRWGGKVFVSNDSQVAWDGGFDGKTVSQGVYVFRFEYVNLLTGLPEEISGDVAVLK